MRGRFELPHWLCHGDVETVVGHANRKGRELAGGFLIEKIQDQRVNGVTTKIRNVEAEEGGECPSQVLFVQRADADQYLAEEAAGIALHGESLLKLRVGDDVARNELVAQTEVLSLFSRESLDVQRVDRVRCRYGVRD